MVEDLVRIFRGGNRDYSEEETCSMEQVSIFLPSVEETKEGIKRNGA